jgi:hypothetical protein
VERRGANRSFSAKARPTQPPQVSAATAAAPEVAVNDAEWQEFREVPVCRTAGAAPQFTFGHYRPMRRQVNDYSRLLRIASRLHL